MKGCVVRWKWFGEFVYLGDGVGVFRRCEVAVSSRTRFGWVRFRVAMLEAF